MNGNRSNNQSLKMLLKKIPKKISEASTSMLFVIPAGLALLIAGVIITQMDAPYSGKPLELIFIFTFFFLVGISGLVVTIRREMPPTFLVKGLHAFSLGLIITIISWGLAFLALWKLIRR